MYQLLCLGESCLVPFSSHRYAEIQSLLLIMINQGDKIHHSDCEILKACFLHQRGIVYNCLRLLADVIAVSFTSHLSLYACL
jgi:hypothetical protein